MDHPDPTPAHLLVSQATSGDVGQIRDLAVDNAAFRPDGVGGLDEVLADLTYTLDREEPGND